MFAKKIQHRRARKRRIRARMKGTAQRPRLSVYRSLSRITAQLIDDTAGRTLVAASTKECAERPSVGGARKLGELVAEKAKKLRVSAVVFDRNAYKYHGRVKALAEGARAGGLEF